ncbi:hypothetical protein [Pseudomonas azerbaijanoccidentalis]
MDDALAALHLLSAVKVQTFKLLARISQASIANELWRATDRAPGFVLGLETVKAPNAESIEGLYRASTKPPRRAAGRMLSDRRRHSGKRYTIRHCYTGHPKHL